MINLAQSALGIGSIGRSISSQGRSGFETNVITKLDSIENKLGGNDSGAMPVEQPPAMPVGNLGGNLAQPDPVLPEIQNTGGGDVTPMEGGFDPTTQQVANDIYGGDLEKSMALQSRSLI
tara:strand:+ start:2521 stop:2880 length:360 start_codon:yes stop_codon:yes gene_type:complete